MRIITALVACTSAMVSFGQGWTIGTGLGYGFLWPHRPSSWILVDGHASAVEFFTERQVDGSKAWHHDYLMPSYGVSVLSSQLGNAERIGNTLRVLPYMYLPIKRWSRSSFGMCVGWGLGYVSYPFDRLDNSKQIAIGSRLNTAILVMPQYRYSAGRWMIGAGVGIDHWSNGSYQLPNLGLNYLSAKLEVGYRVQRPSGNVLEPVQEEAAEPKREGTVIGSVGRSETAAPLSGQYMVYSLTGQMQWRVSRKSRVSAGVDVFNKGSLVTLYPELDINDRISLTQFGVHGGYALGFGKGELFFNMGLYAYTPKPDESLFFHRTGIRYRTGKHLIWNLSLKSHYAVADHWEIGLGYRWG